MVGSFPGERMTEAGYSILLIQAAEVLPLRDLHSCTKNKLTPSQTQEAISQHEALFQLSKPDHHEDLLLFSKHTCIAQLAAISVKLVES